MGRTDAVFTRSRSSLLTRTVVRASLHLFKCIDVYFIQEQLEELAAERLAAEQAETLRKLTGANVKLFSRAHNFERELSTEIVAC